MPFANQERDDEFDASQTGPAALLRLEIRYLRRDISDLSAAVKDSIQSLHESKASKDTSDDHESRLRILEAKVYWAAGFGAAFGAVTGVLIKAFWH